MQLLNDPTLYQMKEWMEHFLIIFVYRHVAFFFNTDLLTTNCMAKYKSEKMFHIPSKGAEYLFTLIIQNVFD